MKRIATTLLTTLALGTAGSALADSAYQTLPFTQNWNDAGLITVDDDWSGVPGITGFRGDNLTAATGTDPLTITAADDPGVVDVNANRTEPPSLFITGGVAEFDQGFTPVIALQGSGTADAPYLQLYIDATGMENLVLSYRLGDVDASADNSMQQVNAQYRVGTSGSWTNISGSYVADASIGPNNAGLLTPVSVALPPAVNGQAQVQILIMTTNAVGNDEWIGIDDISVTGTDIPVATESSTWGAVKALYR